MLSFFCFSSAKGQHFPELNTNHHQQQHDGGKKLSKAQQQQQAAAAASSDTGSFLRNMTITDEFMKWCGAELKDFHVERKSPRL